MMPEQLVEGSVQWFRMTGYVLAYRAGMEAGRVQEYSGHNVPAGTYDNLMSMRRERYVAQPDGVHLDAFWLKDEIDEHHFDCPDSMWGSYPDLPR
jgi:hypothetical protein